MAAMNLVVLAGGGAELINCSICFQIICALALWPDPALAAHNPQTSIPNSFLS
jgi:hypothetical protein